ncbi:MAG TPA: acyl-CoA dehydrogenase family protein [Acetobacteraceae bacterium]|jgi:alkylation response protein AidB-like acyl-CoA dehydrogenase|nr:acyl-CoA dehydrogenase family protein [Acetobacteraceae bacterium]
MDIATTQESDFIARARALAPAIAAASARIDDQRELPAAIVQRLMDEGFFRLLQPRSLGGAELRPVIFSQVTEALAQADASVAWCVGQNNGCAMSAAYLGEEAAREIFGPATGILAWGPPGAPYEAHPVEGGYRISGTWRFASGSHHASWLGAHMKVAGRTRERTMLFPKSSVRMNDIWHTIGLRGTGSDEYVVENLFVPDHHTLSRDDPAERREQGLLYRFTSNQLYSAGFAGVALGIARATINDFLELPANKTSRGATRPMRENNVVQSQLAQAEARVRSARALLHQVHNDAWANVERSGAQTTEDRTMIRLASTWAITQARETVNTLYHATGSAAVFEANPFEQRLRDMHTVAQQSQGRQLHFETCGQLLFGLNPENQF